MTKKIVYKTTYPNGKIYIGMDLTNSINYFGKPSCRELMEQDFTEEERRVFTITRAILFESEDESDVRREKGELIKKYGSNDPAIGYNQKIEYNEKPTKKVIYKITYPNGKVYIGMNLKKDINDSDSASSELNTRNFTQEKRRMFTITREIIFESEDENVIRQKKTELIKKHRSNDPKKGYNRPPKPSSKN